MANHRPEQTRGVADVAPTARGQAEPGLRLVQEFLDRFGYVASAADVAPGVLDDPTSDALAAYQAFHGLAPTGEFDEATREQMTRPRCALPDMARGIAFATTCAWQQQEITYAFDTGTADIGGGGEFQAVRTAFDTWRAVVPLTFREVAVGDAPDVRIGWRPASDPDLSMVGVALAHADFPPGCGVLNDARPRPVHFDDEEHTWALGAAVDAFDVETVALHEIGHILGLAHTRVAGAVMFPTIAANTTLRRLAPDDISGVQSLYGAPPPPPPPPPPRGRCLIATAAYGSPLAPEIQFLRGIRDGVLREMDWGRRFIDELERHYYRVSPPVAAEMQADPELRRVLRWAIVEPWTYYMKLLVARPDWDRVDLDALDPALRDFLLRLREDMDAWLDGIELPDSFAGADPGRAVEELNAILTYVRRTGGLAYLDALAERGALPLRYAPEREAELAGALRAGGRREEEIRRILHG